MNQFFTNKKKLISKEISSVISESKKISYKDYPWSKDALTRLESFINPGKMIRGLLVVLVAGNKSKSTENDAVKIGSGLEMIHSGILIHDDIMDRDSLRRGMPTIHNQYLNLSKLSNSAESLHYGQGMAVCVGVISYFLAIGQFGKIQNKKVIPNLLRLFSSELSLLGMGQMDDFNTGLMSASSESSVLRIYEQKTGRYTFGLPIMAGLYLSGNPSKKVIQQVGQLSRSLGIIFQLRDDYLGVFGDHKKTGKSVGGDIRERKKTWLYFKLLKVVNAKQKKRLQDLYSAHSIMTKTQQQEVFSLMIEYKIPELIEKELLDHKHQSEVLLAKLPFSKQQKQIMLDLIQYLIRREK